MNLPEQHERLTAYLRGELPSEEITEVQARLLDDPEFAELIVELARQEAVLVEWSRSQLCCQRIRVEDTTVAARRQVRGRLIGIAAGILAAAVILAVFLWNRSPDSMPEQKKAELATVDQAEGLSQIIQADGKILEIKTAMPVRSGDTVKTQGPNSFAVLNYTDGTRLELIGTSTVLCSDNKVTIHRGTVFASVMPKSAANGMEITTPKAKMRILGTKFSLAVTPQQTALSVTEGRVQVTQVRDGKSVEVPGGKRVIANGQTDLKLDDIPKSADTWNEDFEDGLPAGWEIGKFVTKGLPAGSRGGVKPVLTVQKSANESFFVLVTQSIWPEGLCDIKNDSHLHFHYKFSNPGWVQILMGTRSGEAGSAGKFKLYFLEHWGKELKPNDEWWRVPPNTWYRASIPLSKFRWANDRGKAPVAGEHCTGFTFSTQIHDRGLVLDRIWITPDGPNQVQFEPMR